MLAHVGEEGGDAGFHETGAEARTVTGEDRRFHAPDLSGSSVSRSRSGRCLPDVASGGKAVARERRAAASSEGRAPWPAVKRGYAGSMKFSR
ncbi:hypothetical protein QEG98_33670 [Myxococcus sp. MxC21-1]|uniref:hypothetical protein n=1 Tax=Myxococcus sp. MxC21-1 TaxID=3041439 RepID=UPI00292F15E2|nr:hypothetical protein [Myxococcus sp. MxC21-1]WNZ66159.1 hypothetical protein QEG98_33670 [Myxococcus sp. MxC21-1]